jgi:hypothetical protein
LYHIRVANLLKLPWRDILLVGALTLFDLSIHPLTGGPDRLVHDPAVYRLSDPNYLSGDWYTGMAVKSGIYTFYAKLANAWHFLGIPEELWRIILYLCSLALLYYAIIRIARFFHKSILVIPIVALLHVFLLTGNNQPIWLYGPFIHIDGGLAPRTIGMALSFLSLFYLARGSLFASSALLGLATLFHVSNSFIVFTLFLASWIIQAWVTGKDSIRQRLLDLGRKAGLALGIYLLAGGWFALYVASLGGSVPADFPPEKFIWTWTYFRAPYLALPIFGKYWWVRLFAHVLAIVVGWILLRKRVEPATRRGLGIAALVGLGSVVYFFLFYLFAFVWPWVPGFQFYSIRVVYLAYFAAYLFIGLSLVILGREVVTKFLKALGISAKRYATVTLFVAIAVFMALLGVKLAGSFRKPTTENLHTSWQRFAGSLTLSPSSIPQKRPISTPAPTTALYLLSTLEPFLGPPDWNHTPYLPKIVSFKSFGFTKEGLVEWFERMNDVTGGEIQKIYETQKESGKFETVNLEWRKFYSQLTPEQVLVLADKYGFKLFMTYRDLSYPFERVAEDADYQLYRLP